MNYFDLPKIDLHCHLDGSLRPQTVIDLAAEQNIELPSTDAEVIKEMMVAPETCPNLQEYLDRFALPIKVMQTAEGIERISFELFEDAAKENVKYLEVRFAPHLHIQQGLSHEQIIESAVKGMKRAEALYDIKGNYILSAVKFLPSDTIPPVLDAGEKFLGNGVVAFDLAGSELDNFAHDYVTYTQYARDKGYRITIHAGEQGCGQNVYDAIELLGAERIGHGVAIKDHEQAYQRVKQDVVGLEACPSSNVQTKAIPELKLHPLKEFHKDGLPVTINTDNRTVSNTTMTQEVEKVMELFDLTAEDYAQIYRASVEQCFASDEVKQKLMQYI
ncbi:adenosine deaminase [Vibrio brasiliensis]|jgi:adenosine deaminase|uniref:Adenosine deaminase n=1 Tax=Vibrio brasiliensis LMG 20546 TaxID=945543 RepID=E8LX26_9VIBR|nr:adenosine deaminase [Vibrio brasiliensis]EGA64927.1 adenosine deaminase [Vibrio brasiliensis LMG 20546]MCG9725174.1 adenosine deaminase [Vibrio brasiliensis]MCG9782673.1 adenosine deaminase [Vibrio brasiliensis]